VEGMLAGLNLADNIGMVLQKVEKDGRKEPEP
jgi:hypothetical protein